MTRSTRVVVFVLVTLVSLGLWAGPLEAQTIIEGRTGPGSFYGLARPDVWNGDLVVYAHGIIDPGEPVALPSDTNFVAMRTGWLQAGFGVAYSSFSDNGYALKDGVQRTHQLKALFTSKFGLPRRTFLVGHSLGGLIVLAIAERYPSQYDGALPACGVVGGTELEFQYIGNTRVMFDFFYPETLPVIGTAFDVPLGLAYSQSPPTDAFATAYNAIVTNGFSPATPIPYRTVVFGAAAGLPGTMPLNPGNLATSALQTLGFSLRFTNDILGLTNGKMPFDNLTTEYTTNTGNTALDGLLNASVQRYSADPAALNYIRKYYTPTGDLRIPVLTLHNTGDPLVPYFHEAAYLQKVQAAGTTDYLAQWGVNSFGHCNFTAQQMGQAFGALVGWVSGGPKPESKVIQ